jgi:hypothetical protein
MAARKTTVKRTTARKSVEDVTDSVLSAQPEDDKTKKVRTARKAKAVADSAEVTIEKVTQSLTKAGLDITKTLNGVRELFESEISALDIIKEAIVAKQEELEELFDKEVVAASLRDLVLQYETHKAEWERNMEETRQAWLKEQADHKAQIQERDERLQKEREREQEAYEYNKNIARRNEEEAWTLKTAQRAREQKETEDALEKTWREREEALKKAEAEVAAAKDKLDNFDTLVKADVDKHVTVLTSQLKSKFDNEKKISELEFTSEKKLLEHDNKVLRTLVQTKDDEIGKLRVALDKKDSEVKEVAVAAMNAQSGQKALAAVQQTVQSQSSGKSR